jgi:hypothetical protein
LFGMPLCRLEMHEEFCSFHPPDSSGRTGPPDWQRWE